MSKKVIVIGVYAASVIRFRGALLKSLVAANYEVYAMSEYDESVKQELESWGIKHVSIPIKRSKISPFSDLKTLGFFKRQFELIQPDIIIPYTIKPIVWGGFAAKLLGVKTLPIVTGLGYTFQGDGWKRKLLTRIVTMLYQTAVKGAPKVIFQNRDNAQIFLEHKIVNEEQVVIVNGSGVDLTEFPITPLPEIKSKTLHFLCIARLLKEKGLVEYYEAAKTVKSLYKDSVFSLVGGTDPSPDGISLELVNEWHREGIINYCGETKDVKPFLQACHVYVLPSYHEGLPRSTLEALSTGRPIITTDAVGCRETVVDNVNGFKVPVKDSQELASKMLWMIENQNILHKLATESRTIVKSKFDVVKVNEDILQIVHNIT